jgi:uncharacterized membrane protein YqjE
LAADGNRTRPQEIGHLIAEVSEKASLLVREEIELAKAEVAQKAARLGKGLVVVAVAGVFALFGLFMALETLAWFLFWVIGGEIFWGFLVVTVLLFAAAGVAALVGIRWIRRGSPPTPDMAIEEARAIKDTVST